MGDVELVARFQPDGEASWIAIAIAGKDDWSGVWELMEGWTDIAYAQPGDTIGTVTLEFRPEGWAAA